MASASGGIMPENGTPTIRVESGGPYRVSGNVPLARTAQVETEYEEPIDWAPFEPLDVDAEYALCRCGHSASKPFCDDSCQSLTWDSAETADRAPRAARARVFVGKGLVMTDDHSLCTHAGFCGDRFTSVWQMIKHTDDPAIRERMKAMIDRCPSGTLAHALDQESPNDEPVFEKGIGVIKDGPFWIRGGIPVESEDGSPYEVRNRMTLCRCGNSSNKPFCDGSHWETGFQDG
jgi:CDGSH-type Zn-finger protein